jgi:antitoxin component YwqK of YwqJK toxin-antitoxin module
MTQSQRVPLDQLDYRQDGLYYFDGVPFTGVGYGLSDEGKVDVEIEHKDGLLCGRTLEWFPSGAPMVDATYLDGGLHGHAREWHGDGHLSEEGEYAFGITLWKKQWDEAGHLTKDYVLSKTDRRYEEAMRRLAAQGKPPASTRA